VKRIGILSSLLAVCFVIAAQGQTPASKPDPALQRLRGWLGHWTYQIETQATPMGPAGKSSGEADFRMVLGGFFMEVHYREKGSAGNSELIEFVGYDAASNTFFNPYFGSDGSTSTSTLTANGNTFNSSGKISVGGKQYMTRGVDTLSDDGMIATWKGEISTDGKTWMPWYEMKGTKVKPAAKK
jgi:hypothetical protein